VIALSDDHKPDRVRSHRRACANMSSWQCCEGLTYISYCSWTSEGELRLQVVLWRSRACTCVCASTSVPLWSRNKLFFNTPFDQSLLFTDSVSWAS